MQQPSDSQWTVRTESRCDVWLICVCCFQYQRKLSLNIRSDVSHDHLFSLLKNSRQNHKVVNLLVSHVINFAHRFLKADGPFVCVFFLRVLFSWC